MNPKNQNDGKETVASLIKHLEFHLGEIDSGWSESIDQKRIPFQIVWFKNSPVTQATTFMTLGLSQTPLRQPDDSFVRQELLFCCHDTYANEEIASLLLAVGEDLLVEKRALLRGQVLRLASPVIDSSKMQALYCTSPVYFPDEFHEYKGSSPVTSIVWTVPIAKKEAEFITQKGWNRFEDLLVEQNPDLLNLKREGVI